jgi:hypothetical protein
VLSSRDRTLLSPLKPISSHRNPESRLLGLVNFRHREKYVVDLRIMTYGVRSFLPSKLYLATFSRQIARPARPGRAKRASKEPKLRSFRGWAGSLGAADGHNRNPQPQRSYGGRA